MLLYTSDKYDSIHGFVDYMQCDVQSDSRVDDVIFGYSDCFSMYPSGRAGHITLSTGTEKGYPPAAMGASSPRS